MPQTNGRQTQAQPLFTYDSARPRGITRADVMSAAQVAELLDCPKSTVQDWARRGVIPSRKRGRRRIYLRWEVEQWIVAED